ncbi:MAG: hypothetical protein AAGC97_10605 [Planctomycetota bacterium]
MNPVVWMWIGLLVSAPDGTDVTPTNPEDVLSSSTVGLPKTLENVVLPGPELRVLRLEHRNQPFILRILQIYPHGDSHRYDLQYQALEPGSYCLTDYLEGVDGGDTGDLPRLNVLVESTLPAGTTQPTSLPESDIGRFGGYRLWLGVGAFVWILGLLALIFVGRSSARNDEDSSAGEQPVDQLEPLVAAAISGDLPKDQRAILERAVMGFWTDELNLNRLPPATISEKLRQHEHAGPMLKSLETWLHSPHGDDNIDLETVLAPIRQTTRDPIVNPPVGVSER